MGNRVACTTEESNLRVRRVTLSQETIIPGLTKELIKANLGSIMREPAVLIEPNTLFEDRYALQVAPSIINGNQETIPICISNPKEY